MRKTNVNKESRAFASAAMVVPAAEAAMGCNPIVVMGASAIAYGLCSILALGESEDSKLVRYLQTPFLIIMTAYYLERTSECWPAEGAEYTVPLVLLVLVAYAVMKKAERKASNVLRYGMYAILVLVIVSGVKKINWEIALPNWGGADLSLLGVLILPMIGEEKKEASLAAGISASVAAIMTIGTTAQGIYAYSRSLTLHGVTEHIESLVACAVTVGWFTALCWILKKQIKEDDERGKVIVYALLAYALMAAKNGAVQLLKG